MSSASISPAFMIIFKPHQGRERTHLVLRWNLGFLDFSQTLPFPLSMMSPHSFTHTRGLECAHLFDMA